MIKLSGTMVREIEKIISNGKRCEVILTKDGVAIYSIDRKREYKGS